MNAWRIIKDVPRLAGLNLAIDEFLLKQVNDDSTRYILKFNYFYPSAVILGLNQDINDLDLDFIKKRNFKLNRRLTGGAAILIGFPNEYSQMGISFITPINSKIPSKLSHKFKLFSSILIESLKEIGLEPVYNRNSDISVNGRKIIGNGIYIMEHALLFHSVVLFEFDFSTTIQILKQKINEKYENFSPTSFSNESKSKINIKEFEEIVIKQVNKQWNMDSTEKLLLDDEIKASENLYSIKYETKKWIFQKNEELLDIGSCFIPNID